MFINPYEGRLEIKPVRSNFHIHAGTGPGTCGAYDIDPVVDAYKQCGYGALCLSNHNVYTDAAPYAEKYGMVIFTGYEYTAREHMLGINTGKIVPLPEDVIFRPAEEGLIQGEHGMVHRRRNIENLQLAIDTCKADGGYSIICHPDCPTWGSSREVIDTVKGYDAIELLNGQNASDTYDHILSQRLLKWATGSDDFHRWWNLAHCWNMIYAEETPGAVMEAMNTGAMYVSTGAILRRFEISEGRLYVKAVEHNGHDYTMGYKFIGKDGRVLKYTEDTEASYKFFGNEGYVRLDITSPAGEKVLTQPVYDDGFFNG